MLSNAYLTRSLPKAQESADQPCSFPEVYLTLGAPGDHFVIPLSQAPCRPLSLNLNLVPKEDFKSKHHSPSHASPKGSRSGPSSPNTVTTRNASPATPSPHEHRTLVSSPFTPDEDCFSLIEKIHTAHLQNVMAHGGQKCKKDPGKGKEKIEQDKGKGGGKKDRKNGGNK